MTDIKLLKERALKLCNEYIKGIFVMPKDLDYTATEYLALGKLADIYFSLQRGDITRPEAVSQQQQVISKLKE